VQICINLEAPAEQGALVIVARLVDHRVAQPGEPFEAGGRSLDGIGAGRAVVGVGRGEERVPSDSLSLRQSYKLARVFKKSK
jgi:hypothetical protein